MIKPHTLRCTARTSTLSLWVLALSLPTTAMAEFQPLDDGTLSGVTGQAGVTIELETKINIDRLAWTDEGTLSVNDMRLSGHNDTVFDNLKLTVDIAGTGEILAHGFSEIARRADAELLSTSNADIADALAKY